MPPSKRPDLAEVLAYRNEAVLLSFLRSWAVSRHEAEELFDETKRMLWLINELHHESPADLEFNIDHSLTGLDAMWHTFILFTQDYADFCERHFGTFLHHQPTPESDEEKATRHAKFFQLPPEEQVRTVADSKRRQYQYVYAKLGKEVFLKWYTEFHQKYSAKRLAELHLARYAD